MEYLTAPIWSYVENVGFILGGILFHAVSTGKLSRTDANMEYWSDLRARHPLFMKYGPPFLVAVGVLRIGLQLLD